MLVTLSKSKEIRPLRSLFWKEVSILCKCERGDRWLFGKLLITAKQGCGGEARLWAAEKSELISATMLSS